MENGNGFKPIKPEECSSNQDFIDKGGDLLSLINDYYSMREVKFLIATQAKQREIVLFHKEPMAQKLMVVRPLFLSRPSDRYMDWFFSRFNFHHNAFDAKIYASTFKIDWDVTGFPPKDLKGLKEYRNGFNKLFSKALIEADFVMDIDADKTAIAEGRSTREQEFLKTKAWANKLHDYMMLNNIPHFVLFSGGAGFNIRIPAEFLPRWDSWYSKAQKLAKYFAEKAGVPHGDKEGVDLGVYDTRRIFAIPYTMKNGKVVLPVNTKELQGFEYTDYDLVSIFRMGVAEMALFNHFTNHLKPEEESHLGDGVVYNYGHKGKETLKNILNRV